MFDSQSLILAIRNSELSNIKRILNTAPHFLDKPLTDKGETALMLACRSSRDDIVEYLLESGANVCYQTQSGETALLYAIESNRANIEILLDEYTPKTVYPRELLPCLKATYKSTQEPLDLLTNPLDKYKADMIALIDAFLEETLKCYPLTSEKLVDICLSLTAFREIISVKSKVLLQSRLKAFFNARSLLVRGTRLDFNHIATINNCFKQIVRLVWGKEISSGTLTVNQVLFDDALTYFSGKKLAWAPQGSEYDPTFDIGKPAPLLSDEKKSFIRDEFNAIHEPVAMVNIIIDKLKQGKVTPDEIWIGSDERDSRQHPVTESTKRLMIARSQKLRQLNEYIDSRYQEELRCGIQHHLEALAKGLIAGDRTHGANQLYAGENAFVAQVNFVEWWKALEKRAPTLTQKIYAYTMYSSHEHYSHNNEPRKISMAEILDPILDARANADRSSSSFCVETIGRRLFEFLSNRDILNQISEDADIKTKAKSSDELDTIRDTIISELEADKASVDSLNAFSPCFEKSDELVGWLSLLLSSGKGLSYFDLKAITTHLKLLDTSLTEGSDAHLRPKPLLKKDREDLINTAIAKDFKSMLLHLVDELNDDHFHHMSYQTLKFCLKLAHAKHLSISKAIIKYSLDKAIEHQDGDWIVFLAQNNLIEGSTQVDFFETRYPTLQPGVRISLPKQAMTAANQYTILRRIGSTLYLGCDEASPDEDIELSLLAHEKIAEVRVFDPAHSNYKELQQTFHSTSLIHFALVSNNLTLFLYLFEKKGQAPDFSYLLSIDKKTFIDLDFSCKVIEAMLKQDKSSVSQEILTTFFDAIRSSKRYDLYIPFIGFGIEVTTIIPSELSYFDIHSIKKEDKYLFFNPVLNKWEKMKVTEVDNRNAVIRAHFIPTHRSYDQSLLPMWVNLSSPQTLTQMAEQSQLTEINKDRAPKTLDKVTRVNKDKLLPFAFQANATKLWRHIIENKIDRDDNLLLSSDLLKCKQYILSLNKVGLELQDKVITQCLSRVYKTTPLDEDLLLLLFKQNQDASLTFFKSKKITCPLSWAIRINVTTLIPLFMSWELECSESFIAHLLSSNKQGLSVFLQGLSENDVFYQSKLDDKTNVNLFLAAASFDLLEKHHLLFEKIFDDRPKLLDNIYQSLKLLDDLTCNQIIIAMMIFFDDYLRLESVSDTIPSHIQGSALEAPYLKRLEGAKQKQSDTVSKRLRVASCACEILKASKQISKEAIEALAFFARMPINVRKPLGRQAVDCYIEIVEMAIASGRMSLVSPFLEHLTPNKQINLRMMGMLQAIKTRNERLFNECVHDEALLKKQFLKVYNALYHTKAFSFFRSRHSWHDRSPTLQAIFYYCTDKPSSRSAQALNIVIKDLAGFQDRASEEEKLILFNDIYRTSMAQSWFSCSHLFNESERTLQKINQYATEHTHTRTASICQALEWSSPSKR